MFCGLLPVVTPFTASAASPANERPHTRVTVRESGRATYRERLYPVVHDDDHRYTRLLQSVRADMSFTDARVKRAELVLVNPETRRDVTSQAALDRLIRARGEIALAYRIHESRAPAAHVALPPQPSIEIKLTAAQRNARPAEAPLTADQRRAVEVERLRETISSSMAEAIAGAREVPFEDHARSVMTRHRASLSMVGARHPHALANQIAFDIASAAANADTRLMTPANCREIYRLRLAESPVWAAIGDAISEQLEDEVPSARAPAPIATDRSTATPRVFDYTAKAPAMNLSLFVYNSGVTPLPTAKKPAAVAPVKKTPTVVPIAVSLDEPETDSLADVGFKPYAAGDYRTVERVSAEPVLFRPFVESIAGDAHSKPKDKATRCKMARLQVDNGAAEKGINVFVDGKLIGTVAVGNNILRLGSRRFWLTPGVHRMRYVSVGKHEKVYLDEDYTFVAGNRYLISITAANEAGVRPVYAVSPFKLAARAVDGAATIVNSAATAITNAATKVTNAVTTSIRASMPAGYAVSLIDVKSGSVSAVGAEYVNVASGAKRIRFTAADGRVKELPDVFLLHPSTRSSFELSRNDDARHVWRLIPDGDASAAYAGQLAARPVPVDGELMVLHTDGACALVPGGALTFDTHTGDEAVIESRDNREYIFDAERRHAFDADEHPLVVQAVFDHPRNPRAKVVVLPKATIRPVSK